MARRREPSQAASFRCIASNRQFADRAEDLGLRAPCMAGTISGSRPQGKLGLRSLIKVNGRSGRRRRKRGPAASTHASQADPRFGSQAHAAFTVRDRNTGVALKNSVHTRPFHTARAKSRLSRCKRRPRAIHSIVPGSSGGWTPIRWALRHEHGTLAHGRVDCLSWVLPKSGDLPRSPLSKNGSPMPSAGAIFNLKIDVGSRCRCY